MVPSNSPWNSPTMVVLYLSHDELPKSAIRTHNPVLSIKRFAPAINGIKINRLFVLAVHFCPIGHNRNYPKRLNHGVSLKYAKDIL